MSLAACGGGGGGGSDSGRKVVDNNGGGGGSTTRYELDLSEAAFFAWQNGGDNAAWQALPVGSNATVSIEPGGEFSIAYTCDYDGLTEVRVEHLDADFSDTIADAPDAGRLCHQPSDPVTVSFDIRNPHGIGTEILFPAESDRYSYSDMGYFSSSSGGGSIDVQPGTDLTLYAVERGDTGNTTHVLKIGDGLDLQQDSHFVVDFNNAVVVDGSVDLTVDNAQLRSSETLSVRSDLSLFNNDRQQVSLFTLGQQQLDPDRMTGAVPVFSAGNAAQLSNDVLYRLLAATNFTGPHWPSGQFMIEMRSSTVYTAMPVDASLALPDMAADVITAHIAERLPADRGMQLGIDWQCPIAVPTKQALAIQRMPMDESTSVMWIASRTSARIAADGARRYVFPDLSALAGWNSEWSLQDGDQTMVLESCLSGSRNSIDSYAFLGHQFDQFDFAELEEQSYVQGTGGTIGESITELP